MTNKKRSVEYDKKGSPFSDAPRKNSAKKVRVSFLRHWYSPPVTETGKVDYSRAAEELRQEITGGTLRFSNYTEDGGLGFPAEVTITSRSELDAFIRAIRAVFKEGVRQANAAREAGLDRCMERLAGSGRESAREVKRRRGRDRRGGPDRRTADRRERRMTPLIDLRQGERRMGEDRRSGVDRRAA
jgi:hypothetical protein